MLPQEILSRAERNYETYSISNFDFAEVDVLQAKGLLRCKLLQRQGYYEDCLVLGGEYYPKVGDQGILFFVGKQKYPCFYAFQSGLSGQGAGDIYVDVKSLTDLNMLQKDILEKVGAMAGRLGINRDWLLIMIYFESRFETTAVSHTGAVGLIQFTGDSITDMNRIYSMNLTKKVILGMSIEEQLELVELYYVMRINEHGKLTTIEDVMMAVFYPASIGNPDYIFPEEIQSSNGGIKTPREYVEMALKSAGLK